MTQTQKIKAATVLIATGRRAVKLIWQMMNALTLVTGCSELVAHAAIINAENHSAACHARTAVTKDYKCICGKGER